LPLLNIGFDLPQRWIEKQLRAGGAIFEWKIDAGPGLTMSGFRAEIARNLDKYKDDPRLIVVDPQSVICERDHCYLVRDGQANFRDTAHISNVNAMQFRALFDAAFKSALRAGTEAEKTMN
jgi:SGNH domain (fused to AT3 domains)